MDNKNDKQEKSMEDKDSIQSDSSFAETENEGRNSQADPLETHSETLNNWVREIPDNPQELSDDITESLINVPVSKGDLPDWINTISPEDP